MFAPDRSPRLGRPPDFDNLRRTLRRQGPPGPVPLLEAYADPAAIEAMLGEPIRLNGHNPDGLTPSLGVDDFANTRRLIDMVVRFRYCMGYDFAVMYPGIDFRRSVVAAADTAGRSNWGNGLRYWQNETAGPIQSWASFESYPWPRPQGISYAAIEHMNATLPDGMKACVNLTGLFENSTWLMGLQTFCLALSDQPDLVKAVCDRVGEIILAAVAHAATYENVGMFLLGDDLGYAGGTFVSPDILREYIFPHHRRLCETAHRAGKLMLLHCCGNVEDVMEDIINIGFDGKHSFEDKIMPVEEAYRRWGDRIAILGGLDMDLLARGSEEQVRRRTREILEVCGAQGTGYCLGTGNTVANYVPEANYLVMVEEGGRWNRERFG